MRQQQGNGGALRGGNGTGSCRAANELLTCQDWELDCTAVPQLHSSCRCTHAAERAAAEGCWNKEVPCLECPWTLGQYSGNISCFFHSHWCMLRDTACCMRKRDALHLVSMVAEVRCTLIGNGANTPVICIDCPFQTACGCVVNDAHDSISSPCDLPCYSNTVTLTLERTWRCSCGKRKGLPRVCP